MKIVVTGANGQVGQELMHCQTAHQLIGLTKTQLDIAQFEQVQNTLKQIAPDLIINAAAYTQVDKAEQEKDLAFAVNATGAANLARYCAAQKIPLLHISTDYVFSGEQTTPYRETDPTQPISVYGHTKLVGEHLIQKELTQNIILRVSGVFGYYGNNFVKTMIKLAREKPELRVVADTTICPTPALAIAQTLLRICDFIQKNPQANYAGIYHFCSDEPTSWHQYAKEIIKQAAQYETLQVKEIHAVPAAEYPTPAKRPHYSVLDNHKIQQQFAMPACSWRHGLAEMLKRVYL